MQKLRQGTGEAGPNTSFVSPTPYEAFTSRRAKPLCPIDTAACPTFFLARSPGVDSKCAERTTPARPITGAAHAAIPKSGRQRVANSFLHKEEFQVIGPRNLLRFCNFSVRNELAVQPEEPGRVSRRFFDVARIRRHRPRGTRLHRQDRTDQRLRPTHRLIIEDAASDPGDQQNAIGDPEEV